MFGVTASKWPRWVLNSGFPTSEETHCSFCLIAPFRRHILHTAIASLLPTLLHPTFKAETQHKSSSGSGEVGSQRYNGVFSWQNTFKLVIPFDPLNRLSLTIGHRGSERCWLDNITKLARGPCRAVTQVCLFASYRSVTSTPRPHIVSIELFL